jgi:hypothetical protein
MRWQGRFHDLTAIICLSGMGRQTDKKDKGRNMPASRK